MADRRRRVGSHYLDIVAMKPLFSEKITRQRKTIGDYVPAVGTNVRLTIMREHRRIKRQQEIEREQAVKVRTLRARDGS